jgi:hypothetical protein
VVGEGHRQEVMDAQFKEMSTAAIKVPDAVLGWNWPKHALQLVAHFHHAGDSYGWGRAEYYKQEGGPDAGALWLAWMKLLAGKPEANGLHLVSGQTHHAVELRAWGGGAALASLQNASSVKTTKAKLQAAPFLAGHVAMILPDGATYYVWPRLTLEQEKALGGGDDREFFTRINGLGMSAMLDELAARKKDLTRWQRGEDTRLLASAETNEERIWFAMKVVSSGKVPGRPGGNDVEGNALVPEAQAVEAEEWLAKNKNK